jgi:PAS domain S-box-containing protein
VVHETGVMSMTGPDGSSLSVPVNQQLLLDILDTVREPLLVLDPTFRVTHANRAFLRMFRVTAEDTIGEDLFSLGDGQWDIPPLRALLHDKLSIEPRLYDVDVDHAFPRIGRKIMLLNARLVVHGPNAPRMILLAIEDVTSRRRAERKVEEQRRELERSNAALEEFASVASHDLQEPLRKILAFGERLNTSAGATLDASSRHSLERMLHAAARMRALIHALLAYSQVTTRVRHFAPTDLAVVVREVIADLETTVVEANGRVEIGSLPVVHADAAQMRQLLQNLIGNALKYRHPDRPVVVRIGSAHGDGALATITITDNGIGFDAEYAEKIFKLYERLHSRSEYDGSGIGLSICRKIVERHGGTIAATGISGEGATFVVTLPVTQAATESTGAASE